MGIELLKDIEIFVLLVNSRQDSSSNRFSTNCPDVFLNTCFVPPGFPTVVIYSMLASSEINFFYPLFSPSPLPALFLKLVYKMAFLPLQQDNLGTSMPDLDKKL